MTRLRTLSFLLAATALTACGGSDSVPENIFAPLGEVAPYATPAQQETFARGQAVAEHRFTLEEGLGPKFNLAFCGGCHERPVFGGSAGRYRDFLLVHEEINGDQAPVGVNGVQPHYDAGRGREPTDELADITARRNPIPFFGVGLLVELPESAIMENEDEFDEDGDGISGRPNFASGFVGRLGRKAQTVSVEGFIRGPLFNHLGITSDPLTNEARNRLPVASGSDANNVRGTSDGLGAVSSAQAEAPSEPNFDDDAVPDPELSSTELFDLVSWAMLLGAPQPDAPTEESEAGAAVFDAINCSGCHVPTLRGERGLIPAYSDLLLHDMGEDLADGIEMGRATGSEFRTQPLWGIVATGPYLHDGRADTLDEAIRFHGGEAQASRDAYVALNDGERRQLMAFLASLGGRDQATEGLVPPNAPIPPVGAYGGPQATLSDADEERFLAGRSVFDRDRFATEGLGPNFNGDSCRACHFEPIVGGAGPIDVNVVRQAIVEGGEVTLPGMGTLTHRFTTVAARPEIDGDANLFELRQTPPIFGLGLIDRIPEALIVANEDPDDADEDGISGRAHRLTDGRLGRLGWKAQVPSLAEFSRDALSAEVGLTLPEQDGLTFGATSDDDEFPDPEITLEEVEALTFFMSSLSSPPRIRSVPDAEDRGEATFMAIGCGDCHTTFALEDGTDVALYSDLLLHDVMPATAIGVADGDATGREFRTTPLWGASQSGPYMHDGRSATLEDAIARHFSEGARAAEGYAALDWDERQELLLFLESL